MDDVVSLMELPTRTLVALAGGYLGYRISAAGKGTDHNAADVVFGALVFAMVCQVASDLAAAITRSELAQAMVGIQAAVLAAMMWRRNLEKLAAQLLRSFGVSVSDRHLTAWDPLRADARLRPSQVTVHLQGGDVLMCERLSHFSNRPTGACRFGADGSIAMYVTHRFPNGASDWEECDVTGPDDRGSLISYIPASAIIRIDVRY